VAAIRSSPALTKVARALSEKHAMSPSAQLRHLRRVSTLNAGGSLVGRVADKNTENRIGPFYTHKRITPGRPLWNVLYFTATTRGRHGVSSDAGPTAGEMLNLGNDVATARAAKG